MTSNPDITITRDQIPAVDRPKNTDAEKAFFQGVGADVPELSPYESEEVDLLFREMEELGAEEAFSRRSDLFDATRGDVAAFERKLEAEGGHYESLAKDIAANRRAEEAKELAEDLKEINVRKRASFKEAARELLHRLETAPAAKIKDETLERKAAKAEKQADTKGRRAAFFKNLGQEITHFGKTAEKRREAVREALRAGYRAPEKQPRPAAVEKKLPEPQTLEEVMPQLQERLQARLKDTVNDIEKKVQDIRRMEQGPIDTKQVAIDNDVLLNLTRLKRVIEADLAAMDANAAEGKGFEDALKAAEAELATEEAKVDKEGIAAAEKALAEAQTALELAEALKKETNEALQKDNDLIARLEKKLETAPQRHIPQRPIELRLSALHPHAIGLRDAFHKAERDEAKAQASLEEKKSTLEALTAGVKATEGKVAAARLPMEAWKQQKGTDKDPAMIAGRKEFDRIQKARAVILDAHFGGAKGDAVDTTLFRLPLDQLQEHVEKFETAARNDPTNPVLSEMATRYRSELDQRTSVSETARRDAEQAETNRQQRIEDVKRDHQTWLGYKEAAEKMLASSDPAEQSIGRRAMSDLLKKRDEISSRLRELGGGFTWEELQTLKPIPLSGTERKRWRGKYAPRVGRVIEGIPTEDETLARLGLDRMNTNRLEKLLSELHGAIAQADVPSDDDVHRSETIERILLERASNEPDISDAEASRLATLSKPLNLTERDAFVQDLQRLSLEDLIGRSKEDLEFFDVDPTNPGFSQRAELYKHELMRRMEDEDAQGKMSRNLQRTLTKIARAHNIVSSETHVATAIDAKRAGERDVQEEQTEGVEEAAIAAELSPRRQTHRRTEKARKIIVDGLPNRRETATMDETGNVRYQEDTATDKDARLVGNPLEATRARAAVDESKMKTLRTQGLADVAASRANVTTTEAMLKREAEAKAQAREEAEDTTAVLARAKALFKETPAERREQASKVPLSELAVMILTAKDASLEKRKTEEDPKGLKLIKDLRKIFEARIDTPEKIRAELAREPDEDMRAQLEERLPPASDETSAA